MSQVHFVSVIENAKDPEKELKQDCFFLLNRVYEPANDAFRYHLSLVLRREKSPVADSAGHFRYSLPFLEKGFMGRYLVLLHGKTGVFDEPVFSLLHPDPKRFPGGSRHSELFLEDGTIAPLTKRCRYVLYEPENLAEKDITGEGIFGFTDSLEVEPTLEHRFYYRIEFLRKIEIPYLLSTSRGAFQIHFLALPAHKEPLVVRFLGSANPLYSALSILNEDVQITLPPSKEEGELSFTLKVADPSLRYFRPYLAEDSQRDYFLFRDVSLAKESEIVYPKNFASKEKRCPFCKEKIQLGDKNFQKAAAGYSVDCQGKQKGPSLQSLGLRKKRLFCTSYDSSSATLAMVVFPENWMKKRVKNTFVGLTGLASSGKSAYLSAVLGLQNGNGANLQGYLNPYVGRFGINFTLLPTQRFAKIKDHYRISNVLNQVYRSADEDANDASLGEEKAIFSSFQENVDNSWSNTNVEDRIYPFILQAGLTNLVIGDIDGESANASDEGIDSVKLRSMDVADAFLVIVSPGDSSFKRAIARITEKDDKHSKGNEDNVHKPIAVLLSKFDRLWDKAGFDPSNASLLDDTYALADGGSYEGSPLQRNIDQASLEIKSYIKDHLKDFPLGELDRFPNVKYFALSSLGDPRAVDFGGPREGSSQNADVLFYLTPTRVELPLIWILHQTGIIS